MELFALVFPSRGMLFVAPALYYLMAFRFASRIVRESKVPFRFSIPLFAAFNAGLLLYFSFQSSVPASMLTMTSIPVIIVLEMLMVIISKVCRICMVLRM